MCAFVCERVRVRVTVCERVRVSVRERDRGFECMCRASHQGIIMFSLLIIPGYFEALGFRDQCLRSQGGKDP